MIAAILRAQFLSMRMGTSRGAVFSLITGIVWYGFWCFASYGIYSLAASANAAILRASLAIAFLLVFLYWQVVPVISASMGSSLDMRKLLVYPVPHGKLFLVEVLLRLTTGVEMILVLAAGTAGLWRNPAMSRAAMRALLPAVLVFIVFNLLLASGLRSLIERLLARRLVREVMIFILLAAITVPRLVMVSGTHIGAMPGLTGLLAFEFPWTAAARVAFGNPLSLLSLCAWTLLSGWFGRRQFERNLRFDTSAVQATDLAPKSQRRQSLTARLYRLPSLIWRDPLAAIVEKELRSLARTPRFRMVFVMGFSFGLLVWLPSILRHGVRQNSGMSHHFLTIVCVYALTLLGQVSYWNCFGFDRSATQIYFIIPLRFGSVLRGKNVASVLFIFLEMLILTAITLAIQAGAGWAGIIEAFTVVAVCTLYMLALGNVSSVYYPRPLTPERVSQGGASSRFQALIFVLYPLALLPVFLAYLAAFAFDSQWVFFVGLAMAAGIGGILYWIALDSAISASTKKRERMLQELSKGDGPVVSN
ncbi:MAG TPA: hypothetical protein VG675_14475 [Bryobacteraceae bacterium]|nr:hypothetical protein [Bryobacteraceae bacterium]